MTVERHDLVWHADEDELLGDGAHHVRDVSHGGVSLHRHDDSKAHALARVGIQMKVAGDAVDGRHLTARCACDEAAEILQEIAVSAEELVNE